MDKTIVNDAVVAIQPYNLATNEYMMQMQHIIEEKCRTIKYLSVKTGQVDFKDVDYLYLNWIESTLDNRDKYIITKAKSEGIKIIWVFHNRIPHDSEDKIVAIEKMKFMISAADTIIIHSSKSIQLLREYVPQIDTSKVKFIPHINYIGMYEDYIPDFRKRMGFAKNDFVIGFLGVIRPYKNLELLLDCFSSKKIINKNIKLLIIGKCNDSGYCKIIEEKVNRIPNAIFINRFISNLAMKSVLDAIDVQVLPYDVKSSMNSGSMIMDFSYKKTVIVPNIMMCSDFPDDLIYKYEYSDEKDHKEKLVNAVLSAYSKGIEDAQKKGELLFDFVRRFNSKEIVSDKLLSLFIDNKQHKTFPTIEHSTETLQYLFDMTITWLELEKSGVDIVEFFRGLEAKNIAIYGIGKVGRLLIKTLTENNINIAYGIDKNPNVVCDGVEVLLPESQLPAVDILIITTYGYEEITKKLSHLNSECKILQLSDIIQTIGLMYDISQREMNNDNKKA